jgi:UDP-N-acetylglucosamine--N-acetylmuramyl-(pentapeptide) pyrophosphoryl-undecaprenol N-acetylglucosamine transferase
MRLLITGGGTGGHITPNLAVIKELSKHSNGIEFHYIGGRNSLEERLINEFASSFEKNGKICFYPIYCGKLRRYFSWQNFSDFFRFLAGIWQSFFIIGKIKPNILFSKGGFVSLPVVLGAYLRRVPIFVHESDLSPGLANRLSFRFAKIIFLSFEESKKYLKKFKGEICISGTPVREEVLKGSKERASKLLAFKNNLKTIFFIGGSTGAMQINKLIEDNFMELKEKFNIIHQSGEGKNIKIKDDNYRQFSYIKDEFADFLALSDIVVSRAGANSLFELALLKKKALIIPMESGRGDQILNADIFSKKMGWPVLKGKIKSKDFLDSIKMALENTRNECDYFKNGSVRISEKILNHKK